MIPISYFALYKMEGRSKTWSDVWIKAFLSILWIYILVVSLCIVLYEVIKGMKNLKPPKWL